MFQTAPEEITVTIYPCKNRFPDNALHFKVLHVELQNGYMWTVEFALWSVQLLDVWGPFKKKKKKNARVKWESKQIKILWLRLKLQQISCPQLNVLYEVSEYLAGMSSTFV